MEDMDAALQTLETLCALGVHLAIDDFGTGYSSLSYLQRFPVEMVKIDRSFVRTLGESAAASTIVDSITALAHMLGMSVTAEGVETPEQLALVARAACDVSQGYYFARPLPADGMTRLLAAGAPVHLGSAAAAA